MKGFSGQPILTIGKKILDWHFPRTCFTCKQNTPNQDTCFCNDCHHSLPFFYSNTHAHCAHCGHTLFSKQSDLCGHCLTNPPSYDVCFCPFQYAPPIHDMIHQLKYQHAISLAKELARLLLHEAILYDIRLPDLLIPVPSHKKKLQKRGFNQSSLIARALGSFTGITVDMHSVKKTRNTHTQTGLSRDLRQSNLKQAFVINKKITATSIAIIDDVMTTGSTLAEMAKTIQQGCDVENIQVWAVARNT